MSKITEISGQKIMDSRGKPTVEVRVSTENGFFGIDSVPSGTSTGKKEAALVDVDVAISNINQIIAPALKGMEITNQAEIDQKMIELDGTENKNKLGGNAILGVSLASARTASREEKIPLYKYINNLFSNICGSKVEMKVPTPMMVMLCGGKHVEAEIKPGIQEFLILGELNDGVTVWQTLKQSFESRGVHYILGLEGAFAPEIDNTEALSVLMSAIEDSGLSSKVKIGLDVAGNNCPLSNDEIVDLFKNHNIFSIEDPFSEEDWEKFGQLKLELEETKKPFLLIGDDLFATKEKFLQKGITHLVANGIIIKPNQAGTLTEVLKVMKIAKSANYKCIVSHRSGETIDSFIADLAVGTSADYLKSGAPIPSERLVKYRRLEEISKEL